ncbi:MAG: signal peptidase I, partial [Dehalococcoidia bacterium]|nr:signal peptidase I [Dehalococcoidia bacterium]
LDDDDIEADEEDWAWSPAVDSVPDELPNLATDLPEEAVSEFASGGEDLEEPAAAFVVAEVEPGPEALVAPLASPDGITEEHGGQPDAETDRESDAVIASADSGDADDEESPETAGQDLRWEPTGDEEGDPAPQESAQSAFSWAATESVDADESPDTADWSDWSDETAFARAFESPAAEGLETGVVSSEASTTDGGDASEESWDFAAALQAGFEEDGQPGDTDEPTVSGAADHAEQATRADIEALDASDVVAAMQAERVEEQDAEGSEPVQDVNAEDDAEEFDFGAALRAAEETVAERELSIADESAGAAGTKPDDEARDAWAPAIDRDEADIVPAVANADPGEAAKEHGDPEPEGWSPAEQPLEMEPEEPAAAWAWDFSPREEEPAPAEGSTVSATREEDPYSLLDDDQAEMEDEVPGQTAAAAKSETDEDADAWSPAFDRDEADTVPAVASVGPGEAAKEHSDPKPEEWSPTEQPLEMEPEEPAAAWASDFSPSEEEPAPAEESTVSATREEDPYSLLDDDPSETEDEVPGQSAAAAQSETDEDADAWAAIAAASGYNAEEEFEPPTFGKISRSPREMDERGSWLADHFPEQPPAPDPVEEAFAEHDDEDMERDLVLRAFEAHAATDVDEEEPLEPGAFQELFGEEAQGIVDDIIEPREVPSFAKMRLAPQRTSAPGSAPFSDDDDWAEGEEDEDMAAAYAGDFEAAPFLAGSLRTADPLDARKTRTWVRELVETGLLALLVFLSVRASFQNFKVDGSSMSPTLADGQFLIVNKLVYSEVDVDKLSKYVPFVSAGDDPTRHVFHGPERGDIIVLRDPSTPTQDLIKRVMGLPGEKIEVYNGAVYINDQRLEEPYLKEAWGRNGQGNYPAVIVPEGTYFVMGDNRDNSKDSRSSQIGFIAEDLIIGRAELSYLPLDAFGLIGNGGATLSEQDGRPRLTSQLKPESAAALASP